MKKCLFHLSLIKNAQKLDDDAHAQSFVALYHPDSPAVGLPPTPDHASPVDDPSHQEHISPPASPVHSDESITPDGPEDSEDDDEEFGGHGGSPNSSPALDAAPSPPVPAPVVLSQCLSSLPAAESAASSFTARPQQQAPQTQLPSIPEDNQPDPEVDEDVEDQPQADTTRSDVRAQVRTFYARLQSVNGLSTNPTEAAVHRLIADTNLSKTSAEKWWNMLRFSGSPHFVSQMSPTYKASLKNRKQRIPFVRLPFPFLFHVYASLVSLLPLLIIVSFFPSSPFHAGRSILKRSWTTKPSSTGFLA